jgi:hypothetical protein
MTVSPVKLTDLRSRMSARVSRKMRTKTRVWRRVKVRARMISAASFSTYLFYN